MSKHRLSKSIQPVVEYAEENGWTWERTKNGHIKFIKGTVQIFTASSASDRRSYLNCLSRLKRVDRGGEV